MWFAHPLDDIWAKTTEAMNFVMSTTTDDGDSAADDHDNDGDGDGVSDGTGGVDGMLMSMLLTVVRVTEVVRVMPY